MPCPVPNMQKCAQRMVGDASKEELFGKLLSKASDIKQLLWPQSSKGRKVCLVLRGFPRITMYSESYLTFYPTRTINIKQSLIIV